MSGTIHWEDGLRSIGRVPDVIPSDALCAAIRAVSPTPPPDAAPEAMRRQVAALLEQVFLSPAQAPRGDLLTRAQADPAFAAALLRQTLPETTRRLGEAWATDRLSFVDVTIASARIQTLVQRLGRGRAPVAADARPVAVVTPPWEQHTLAGAFVAERIRALGVAVLPLALPSLGALIATLSRRPVATAFVTVGCSASLNRLPGLVTAMRGATRQHLSVIAGGPGLLGVSASPARLGVDLVTSDAHEALNACGIAVTRSREGILEDA